jgi:hypothetical protein
MRRSVLASALILLAANSPALAESTFEALGKFGDIDCDAFRKNQDASWTSTRNSVAIIGSNRLAVGAGIVFEQEGTRRKGVAFHLGVGGNDLAAALDRTCGQRS